MIFERRNTIKVTNMRQVSSRLNFDVGFWIPPRDADLAPCRPLTWVIRILHGPQNLAKEKWPAQNLIPQVHGIWSAS